MTKERAKQLLAMTSHGGSVKRAFFGRKGVESKTHANYDVNGITEAEDGYIRSLWNQFSDETSYADILRKIARYGV